MKANGLPVFLMSLIVFGYTAMVACPIVDSDSGVTGGRRVCGVACNANGTKSIRCASIPGRVCPQKVRKCYAVSAGRTMVKICHTGLGNGRCFKSACIADRDDITSRDCDRAVSSKG